MIEFIAGTVLVFLAFVLSTWLFAFVRRLMWLASPVAYNGRYHHGMVFDPETGLAVAQQRPIYRNEI